MLIPTLAAALTLAVAAYAARRFLLARRLAPDGPTPSNRNETRPQGDGTVPALPAGTPVGDGWRVLVMRDLGAVEELLDHLERCGVTESEVRVLGDATFAVRWREAPGEAPH